MRSFSSAFVIVQQLTLPYKNGKKNTMDPADYQKKAALPMNPDLTREERIEMCLPGIAGEVGEIIDIRKKEKFHGVFVTREKYEEEIGDVAWYVANLLTAQGEKYTVMRPIPSEHQDEPGLDETLKKLYVAASHFTVRSARLVNSLLYAVSIQLGCGPFEQILARNIRKLENRYPNGFTTKDSLERRDRL